MSRPTPNPKPNPKSGQSRGGGTSQKGGAKKGGASAPPTLAVQLRQLDQMTGPEEPKLLQQYAPLGFLRIRSEYGLNGLIQRELARITDAGTLEWIPLHMAQLQLEQRKSRDERDSLVARLATRLSLPVTHPLTSLSEEDMRILRMSNKQYSAFRGSRKEATSRQQDETLQEETPEDASSSDDEPDVGGNSQIQGDRKVARALKKAEESAALAAASTPPPKGSAKGKETKTE